MLKVLNTKIPISKLIKYFVHYFMYYKYNLVTGSGKLRTMKRQY